MNTKSKAYTNGEITVYWKPSKCIHATTCFRELIEVFNPLKRPWVNMEGASTERIIEVVEKCPTQALSWKWNRDIKTTDQPEQSSHEEEVTPEDIFALRKEEPVKISLMRNGPILAEGSFKIINADGNELKTMIITSFCRCGNSKTQPYCDGTHRKVGFTA